MAETIKKILLGLVFVVLLLPRLEHAFSFIQIGPLYGAYVTAPDVHITMATWLDGSFQEKESKYLNDNIDFRPYLIRLNCQIDYSLFRKFNTGWGVIGKHGCLLDDVYIKAWNGMDFVGYDTLYTKLVEFKALQDTFARMGKSLILVHAPSKAYYYSDCIPDYMIPATKKPTNFETCVRIGDSLNINQIDFNSWFCAIKDTSKEILYPKGGIHWSVYGAMIAADSLVKYIEHLRKINMPHPRWKNIVHTRDPRLTDNDISESMNLIWPMADETFCYGSTYFETDRTKTKPRAIYIGDSFMWTIIDNYVPDGINSQWEFWFYMKELHTHSGNRDAHSMDNYNWQVALDSADYVVLLYTAPSLNRLGNGFIEAAYNHYFLAKSSVCKSYLSK